MKKSYFLLIALFFVVSCGGGGGGETSSSAVPNNGMSSAVLSEGVSHYKSLVSSGTDKDIAVSDTVNWFKTQKGVTNAYPAADNRNIFIKEANGITTLFATNTFLNPSSSSTQSTLNKIASGNKSLSQLMSSQSIKAIVMDPFNVPSNNSSVVNKVLSDYPNAEVTYLKGPDVTPEILQNLSGYDLIYYVGHGGIDNRNGGLVFIGTGVPYSKIQEYEAKYHDEQHIYLGRVAPLLGGEYIGVNSNFIKDYSKGLNATAVYMDACHSLDSDTNDSMANAFMKNGAKSYLGWGGLVQSWLIFNLTSGVAESFFTNILACKSVSEAFNNLPFDWNRDTDLHYRGDGKLPVCEIPTSVLSSITISPLAPVIELGKTQQYKAAGTFSDGTTKDITASVIWSSSNTGVATISPSGLATSNAAGSATITASSGNISGSTTIIVTASVANLISIKQGTAPIINGVISPGEWDDANTVQINVELGWTVQVYYKRDESNIYVAFENLTHDTRVRYPEVLLDMNNDKTVSWKSDDLWFHVSYNICEGAGQYDVWASCTRTKSDWAANIFPLTHQPGTVEMKISYAKLGLDSITDKTIGIAFDVNDGNSSRYSLFPSTASIGSPSSWGTAVLAH